MSVQTTVVELKLISSGKVETRARFVLLPSGSVEVVPIGLRLEDIRDLVGEELYGREGLVGPQHGRAYLDAVRSSFQGSYLWVTDPFEMDLDEALRSDDPPRGEAATGR